MIHGYSYSSSGLKSREQALQSVANNLANMNSIGFKRTVEFDMSLETDPTKHNVEPLFNEAIDFGQGEIIETGNPLDVAISGNGFFAVHTEGGLSYTRQGNFQLSEEGFLTTKTGDLVLGMNGPISLEPGAVITQEGEVAVGGKVTDQIRLFEFLEKNQVERIGDGYFRPKAEDVVVEMDQVALKTGFLENSNVNAIEEMVRMIQIYREFEMNQRALRTQDETVDKAVNKVGKVG